MKMNPIDQFGMDTADAILCLIDTEKGQFLQALVLVYSAIDTLAWVSKNTGDVTHTDFCKFVNKYMQPETNLGCTAKDLYGARCSILHSSAAESRLSREGKVSELWYVTSAASKVKKEERIKKEGHNAKVICFTSLVKEFTVASSKLSDEVSEDPERKVKCDERLKRWLRFVPTESLSNNA